MAAPVVTGMQQQHLLIFAGFGRRRFCKQDFFESIRLNFFTALRNGVTKANKWQRWKLEFRNRSSSAK
jgi:hypothetical protein